MTPAMNFFNLPIGARAGDPVVGEVDGAKIYQAPDGTRYYEQYQPPQPAAPYMMLDTTLDAQGRAVHDRVPNTTRDKVRAILGPVEGIVQGLTAPGRALQGEPVTYGDAWATALDYGVLSAPTSAPEGALRAGALNHETAPLVIHHNTTGPNLSFADELGGMPYPSLAISRADYPMTNFGDVTLLAGPEMAVPSRANRVYPSDAYTIRQPRGELEFADPKAFERGISSDPRFAHLRGPSWFVDSYSDLSRADDVFKRLELAIGQGVIDPKQYTSMDDLMDALRREMPYASDLSSSRGLSQYGGLKWTLPPEDRFTPSGNRRKNKPYTLENVMAQMRKDAKGANVEGVNYGPKSFRASATPPFRNFGQVSKARGNVMPPEATEAAFGKFSDDYGSLVDDIAKTTGEDGWRASDWAASYANDFAAGNTRDWRGVGWVDNMPPELRQRLLDLADEGRNLPSNYMEAKPQRAMRLGEFEAAIVPEADEATAALLSNAGVRNIATYGTPEERAALFKKFPELLFGIAGAAAYLGMPEDEIRQAVGGS